MYKREGRQLECKVTLTSYTGLLKTVVAFSNDIGGIIVIGLEDKTLKPVGISEDLLEKYMEEIPRAIYDAVTPYCMPQLRTRLIDDKVLLEVDVVRGAKKPYFLKSEGTPKGVYVRVGAHNKRASSELLEDLFREGRRGYWDEEMVRMFFPPKPKHHEFTEALKSLSGMVFREAAKLLPIRL